MVRVHIMFFLRFGSEVKAVTKITRNEFTAFHQELIAKAFLKKGSLLFPNEVWCSIFLGAGEEKAVFCVCDHNNRVFALEILDERNYLNGRFVGGEYFFETLVEKLINIKLQPNSLFGLTFTGRVKAREFVYGYEWARFQFDFRKQSWLDTILTNYLRSVFASQFADYDLLYRDVHHRNVLFEIRKPKEKGLSIIVKDLNGKLRLIKVGLQPIDVR